MYFAYFTLVQKLISNTFVYLSMKYIHAFKKYINISKEEFSLSSYLYNRFSLNYFLLRRKLRNGDKDHHFYFPPFLPLSLPFLLHFQLKKAAIRWILPLFLFGERGGWLGYAAISRLVLKRC